METRANFILIGAFTLFAILGTLGFFIWLASVQINRNYATYGILFDDVSGLDPSGDVLFNGISVGTVIGLQIHDQDPSKVFTTIEIDSTTPVRSDTVAQLQAQGVTGVAYISLSGGTPQAPALVAEDGGLPIIPSRRSTVQTLVEDAPDLLHEATRLLEQFQKLTNSENQVYVRNILRNLDRSSDRLDQALDDFSQISGTVRDATGQITRFTDQLDSIAANADETFGAATRAFDSADAAIKSTQPAIDSAASTLAQTQSLIRDEVPQILAQISDAVTGFSAATTNLQDRTLATLDSFAPTAGLLTARLTELETTLLEANTAFVAVTEASDSFDNLVDGDGTLLVAEARDVLVDAKAALATINGVILTDVPQIMADIRAGVRTATAAVEKVAGDLTDMTGRFDPIVNDARQAMTTASALFDRAQTSLDTLDGTLTSAEAAFDAASAVMDSDMRSAANVCSRSQAARRRQSARWIQARLARIRKRTH